MKYLKPFNESYSYPTDPQEIWRLLREICYHGLQKLVVFTRLQLR